MRPRRAIGMLLVLSATLMGVSCSSMEPASTPSPTPTTDPAAVQAVSLLPSEITDSGVLVVGTDPALQPFSYEAEDGAITGADIELVREMALRLGLNPEFRAFSLEPLLDAVAASEVDIGVAGIFDTAERDAAMDFVPYLTGGTQWAAPSDAQVDPEKSCGLAVVAIAGSVQATQDIPDRSRNCQEAGNQPLRLVTSESAADAAELVLRGEADAFVADTPIVEYLVGRSKGRLAAAGPAYSPQLYGIAVRPDAEGLVQALHVVLESMIDDGTYGRIMGKWGIGQGSISLE